MTSSSIANPNPNANHGANANPGSSPRSWRTCLAQVTLRAEGWESECEAIAKGGWDAVELDADRMARQVEAGRPAAPLARFAADRGLTLAALSGLKGPGPAEVLGHDEEAAQRARDRFRQRLDLAVELGVPRVILTADPTPLPASAPGVVPEADASLFGRWMEALRFQVEQARQRHLALSLEFHRGSRFCASLDTAAAVVAALGGAESGLSVAFDAFHYHCGPSKFDDLSLLHPRNLGWVQVCDLLGVPRELAGDGDRILPGEGDFRLGPLLETLAALGYDGMISLEVPARGFATIPADRVAMIAWHALQRTLELT
ncbi:Xylose isomerase domain-containing protein TIM barrel [Isosphaera pallida ATCC 43644]|jgi:sugar phosphate isomerase/epimerase|uniref:Xylose isomerase domain-containing protein TIM barrel n=1 Tax=Isosphaera pallida (strain ATCC 43644 / DSM 9630 / IS1B) TaxID=575540 RepID=E8R569_ISOPI|nr:sugar phosphate isomerase/epimerase family protein [Isosphaera pallida]ADV63822.1 Xylose isomerase domain-containing protein TIM barrel [Isosphaera pallida ATCC 43644]